MNNAITLQPIGYVKNSRTTAEDDNWAEIPSQIILTDDIIDGALKGLENFSHVQILYYFHLVDDVKARAKVRHPRNNKNWPLIGTYAQRNKSRPNKLGLCTAQIVKVEGNTLHLKYLDAIDGTPVLDIKPVMMEFMPKGDIKQPKWASELMKNYW